MNIDEGVIYFSVLPENDNPLVNGLDCIYSQRPIGVIKPNVFVLIPMIVKFSSKKQVTAQVSEKMHKLMILKIQSLLSVAVERMLETIHDACQWTDVVRAATFDTERGAGIIHVKYGEAFKGILEILSSELIRESMIWEKKYGYTLDVERLSSDIMLVGTCPGDLVATKLKQKIYDQKIQVSARRWKLAMSLKRKIIWQKSWYEVIRTIV